MLAVIAARGGSQRVPSKNIALVAGRPALAYTLEHARAAQRVTRIVVSTEDARIAEVAQNEGAEVLDRPAELSQADTRLDHVVRHALATLYPANDWPDGVVLLYAAVPIRPTGFIDHCIETFRDAGADSVRSVAPVGEKHPLWSVALDVDRRIVEPMGKLTIYRRQDLPSAYFYTGACLVLRPAIVMGRPPDPNDHFWYFGTDRRACIHEPDACVEIHEPIDIAWAEFLISRGNE